MIRSALISLFHVKIQESTTRGILLKSGPRPWTRTLKNLNPKKPGLRKPCTLKNLDSENSELRNTGGNNWTQKKRLVEHL